MKRAIIIFIVLFILTMMIPTIAIVRSNNAQPQKPSNQLVTIFSTESSEQKT